MSLPTSDLHRRTSPLQSKFLDGTVDTSEEPFHRENLRSSTPAFDRSQPVNAVDQRTVNVLQLYSWTAEDVVRRGENAAAQDQKDSGPLNHTTSEVWHHRRQSDGPVHQTFTHAAARRLSRSEDNVGVRTTRLARSMADNTSPSHLSSGLLSRHMSDAVDVRSSRKHTPDNSSTAMQLLSSTALTEFLELDNRLVFILDLLEETNFATARLCALYMNRAFRADDKVVANVLGASNETTSSTSATVTPFAEFKQWALTRSNNEGTAEEAVCIRYAGVKWRSYVLRHQLKVITGVPSAFEASHESISGHAILHELPLEAPSPNDAPVSGVLDTSSIGDLPSSVQQLVQEHSSLRGTMVAPETPTMSNGDAGISDLLAEPPSPAPESKISPVRNNPEGYTVTKTPSMSEKGSFDWTRMPLEANLPAHIRFARSVDWAATSLGPIESWSADLRAMCNLIMASPHPAAMYWGKDNVAIYNEAYIPIAGQKHPSLMGKRYEEAWSEIWDALEDVVQNAHNHAMATMKDDDRLFIQRNGFLEETYFWWSLIPLIGSDGTVVGIYNPGFEKTRRNIAERRMLTLREIGERTAAARRISDFWGHLVRGLEYNEYDAPLVMVYSLQEEPSETESASGSSSTLPFSKLCRLEGALGIGPGHRAAPELINLRTERAGFAPAFRHALMKNKPVVLQAEDGTLDISTLQGIQWRGHGEPSKVVIVSPIQPTTGESTLGFLVMATNPRRPYDEDYDLFVQLLGRQLTTSIASVVLFEEEIRKAEQAAKLAAQDRIDLSNKLRVQTKQAADSENKFTRMAELVPVGIYIGNVEGDLTFVNDAWYDITSFPRDREIGKSWIEQIMDEDVTRASEWWAKIMSGVQASVELRWKTPWTDGAGNRSATTWCLATGHPEKDDDGNVVQVFGSVTNVTAQKFAEELQKRRMEEAIEMKRQQTFFIDSTSHEIRNPLGAILLSADEINANLISLRDSEKLTAEHLTIVHETIDAAQTVALCAKYQKRIVDDVLTLSKLDSAVLQVTPIDSQPQAVMRRALKPFQTELSSADIGVEFREDRSYQDLDIDWVRMDPFRLTQVLINLVTNAIKFTNSQEKRIITLHLAASKDRPTSEDRYRLKYIPTRMPTTKDVTVSPDWGSGETLYIHFAVQDSGRGLSRTETERLFQRFSQANPRTHITYGGSGLGLFICRELVELQGGEIGVSSESGVGSTFAFYVRTRRSQAPVRGFDEAADFWHQGSRKGSARDATGTSSPLEKTVSLPSSRKASEPATSSDPSSLGSLRMARPLSPDRRRPIDPKTLKILIVEDNVINQKVLAKQLRKVGCTIYVANHGVEALEFIAASTYHRNFRDVPEPASDTISTATSSTRHKRPRSSPSNSLIRKLTDPISTTKSFTPPVDEDNRSSQQEPNISSASPIHSGRQSPFEISVVLMDLEMPVMDGMTCARHIREMEASGELADHVPLISVTANAREEQLNACFEGGMDGVVPKPFTVQEVLAKIDETLTKLGQRPGD